jgi:hypothetical protein
MRRKRRGIRPQGIKNRIFFAAEGVDRGRRKIGIYQDNKTVFVLFAFIRVHLRTLFCFVISRYLSSLV